MNKEDTSEKVIAALAALKEKAESTEVSDSAAKEGVDLVSIVKKLSDKKAQASKKESK